MRYTLTWPNQEKTEVRSWNGKITFSEMRWMLGKEVQEVILWCKRYRVQWRVEL